MFRSEQVATEQWANPSFTVNCFDKLSTQAIPYKLVFVQSPDLGWRGSLKGTALLNKRLAWLGIVLMVVSWYVVLSLSAGRELVSVAFFGLLGLVVVTGYLVGLCFFPVVVICINKGADELSVEVRRWGSKKTVIDVVSKAILVTNPVAVYIAGSESGFKGQIWSGWSVTLAAPKTFVPVALLDDRKEAEECCENIGRLLSIPVKFGGAKVLATMPRWSIWSKR